MFKKSMFLNILFVSYETKINTVCRMFGFRFDRTTRLWGPMTFAQYFAQSICDTPVICFGW